MLNSEITKQISVSKNGTFKVPPASSPAATTNEDAEALMVLLETSVHQLNQPLAVILGLSEHLLSQAEQETALAKDLEIIVKEMRRVNEVIQGLKLLTQYQTCFLRHR
jgi:signal transduction histidine kinase